MSFTTTTPVDEAHLKLMLLDGFLLKNLLVAGADSKQIAHGYGRNLYMDIACGMEDILAHLSRAKVAKEFNDQAEVCLQDYHQAPAEDRGMYLVDAIEYITTAIAVAPVSHPERGRAHKIKGISLLANGEPERAMNHFEIAIETFTKLELTDQVNEVLGLMEVRL